MSTNETRHSLYRDMSTYGLLGRDRLVGPHLTLEKENTQSSIQKTSQQAHHHGWVHYPPNKQLNPAFQFCYRDTRGSNDHHKRLCTTDKHSPRRQFAYCVLYSILQVVARAIGNNLLDVICGETPILPRIPSSFFSKSTSLQASIRRLFPGHNITS